MAIPPHVAGRLKVTRAAARAAMPADLAATDAELDAALAGIAQDATYDTHRASLTVQVWDRTSPINGVPAAHFLARDDVAETGDDDIYLLLRDGQVVGFQPHEPDAPGLVRIAKGKGAERGGLHADTIAADNAAGEVLQLVRERILTKRNVR